MVAAKTDQALQNLQKQFKAGRVEKEYVALVRGAPPQPEGRIETLIGRLCSIQGRGACVDPCLGGQPRPRRPRELCESGLDRDAALGKDECLASEESGFTTGANMLIDGGMTRKMIYV